MTILKKLGILSIALLMMFSGCIFTTACGKKDDNIIELNEVTHSIFYAPLYVAINNGYFEDEGLTVNLTNGGGSDTSMSALLTGSADIILAGPGHDAGYASRHAGICGGGHHDASLLHGGHRRLPVRGRFLRRGADRAAKPSR